jgi:hypothetical protein
MATETRTSSIPNPRKRLIRLMQAVNFGRINGLVVRDGQPVFDPPPRVVREIKFGGDNSPRPEIASGDFTLKSQVVEFFDHLSALRNAVVETLEIRHGLPFRMSVQETVRP